MVVCRKFFFRGHFHLYLVPNRYCITALTRKTPLKPVKKRDAQRQRDAVEPPGPGWHLPRYVVDRLAVFNHALPPRPPRAARRGALVARRKRRQTRESLVKKYTPAPPPYNPVRH